MTSRPTEAEIVRFVHCPRCRADRGQQCHIILGDLRPPHYERRNIVEVDPFTAGHGQLVDAVINGPGLTGINVLPGLTPRQRMVWDRMPDARLRAIVYLDQRLMRVAYTERDAEVRAAEAEGMIKLTDAGYELVIYSWDRK